MGLPDLPPLNGILKKDGREVEVPVVLTMEESRIHFSFDNSKQSLTLEIGDKTSSLKEETAGSNVEVAPARYTSSVQGTDLTYEDLSMRYLCWPKPKGADNGQGEKEHQKGLSAKAMPPTGVTSATASAPGCAWCLCPGVPR